MTNEFFHNTTRHLEGAGAWFDRLRGEPSPEVWKAFHTWLAVGPTRLAALLMTGQDVRALADRDQEAGLEKPILTLLLLHIDLLSQERFNRHASGRQSIRLRHPRAARGMHTFCHCRMR
jgi:hypothetical protein